MTILSGYTAYDGSKDARYFYRKNVAQSSHPPTSQAARVNSDLFLEHGKVCYRILRPLYAFSWSLNDYVERYQVEVFRLTHIFWAQFFGPDFSYSIGRNFLAGAPAWRNENMDDEGLLYVLAESPYLFNGPR